MGRCLMCYFSLSCHQSVLPDLVQLKVSVSVAPVSVSLVASCKMAVVHQVRMCVT